MHLGLPLKAKSLVINYEEKNMRFISKTANLHVILRPGLSAQPLTGTPAVPTISVRFQDGVADVRDGDLAEKMLAHPGFNIDFIAADDSGSDLFARQRASSEPAHVITEMKYGHPVGRSVSPVKTEIPAELKKAIAEQATELAKQMLPGLLAELMKTSKEQGSTYSEVSHITETTTSPAVEMTTSSTEVPTVVVACDEEGCGYVATNAKEHLAKNAVRMHKRTHTKNK